MGIFDDIKNTFKNISNYWDSIDTTLQYSENSLLWNPEYHKMKPVPPNALMFGLSIIDWDNSFKKRIGSYNTKDLHIPFQYIEQIPDWVKGANWNEISDIIGRFAPQDIYANSTPQDLELKLYYYAEADRNSEDIGTHWTLENIEKYTKRLQSLVYPMYDGNFSPPPKLKLNIGSIYRDIPVFVKNVSIAWKTPYKIATLQSMLREITLSCRISYPSWQAVSGPKIFVGSANNSVFAYQELDKKYKSSALKLYYKR